MGRAVTDMWEADPPPLRQAFRAADRTVLLVDYTVGGLLQARAAEHPNREAVVGARHGSTATEVLTYAQLLAEAARVAGVLSRLADPGSYVALWAPNVLEWPIIQYGAALAGMVLVALNPVLRDNDLDYALRHSRAAVLLHADLSRDHAMGEIATRVCASIPGVRRISLSDSELWNVEVGAEIPTMPCADPDAAVMLQYTSGTTGRPKGVLLTHRALINVSKLTMQAAHVPEGAVCFNPLPLFHTAGCVVATLGPLWVTGTVLLCERFIPETASATLRSRHVDVLFYVPAILHALLEHQRASGECAPRLRTIMGGASSVSPELIDSATAIFGAEVLNLYGQTELAPVLTMTRPQDSRQDRLTTVGRPLPQVDCKVIDPENGQVMDVGVVGEICARGYQQFIEYLHDPEASARARDPEGYVRTGDLGVMDERGFLTVTGRLKELIIRGGENISPAEVEHVVGQHDKVIEVVALGLPHDRLGEIVAAVCRVRGGHRGDLKDSLIELAHSRLPSYMTPSRWFVIDQFPTTPTGKVQRFALRDAALHDQLDEL